jgi:hypothetical protein
MKWWYQIEIARLRAELASAQEFSRIQWRKKDLAQLDADRLRAELAAARQDAERLREALIRAALQGATDAGDL